MQADDRYPRRTFTLEPDVDKVLEQLHDETGKGYSEIVCLCLLSLRGNQRLIRHALAQPLSALRLNLELAARCVGDDQGMVEVVRTMQEQLRRIDTALASPAAPGRA